MTCDHFPRAVVQGIRRGMRNCRYRLTQGGGMISKAARSNQFDQLSESGQHEKSRRGICGIWSRDLTCDHLPKSVVQGIRCGRGIVPIALRRVEVRFQKCAEI